MSWNDRRPRKAPVGPDGPGLHDDPAEGLPSWPAQWVGYEVMVKTTDDYVAGVVQRVALKPDGEPTVLYLWRSDGQEAIPWGKVLRLRLAGTDAEAFA